MLRKLFSQQNFRHQILSRWHQHMPIHIRSSSFATVAANANHKIAAGHQLRSLNVAASKIPAGMDDISDDFEVSSAYNERTTCAIENPNPAKNLLIRVIRHKLNCNLTTAMRIYNTQAELRHENIKNIVQIVDYLLEMGVTGDSILENPWLISNNFKAITSKIPMILEMKPRNINDFVPLLRATPIRMNKMKKLSISEAGFVPGGHRVYLFSDKLEVEPKIVAKYFSRRMFMFDLTFENLMDNLNLFMQYKMAPINILRDLWAFRYSPGLIEYRLKRATDGQKDKMMPWMIRCPKTILDKSIQISMIEKEVLGDSNDVVEYIANRIGYDLATTKYILQKHPSVYNVRMTKVY